MTTLDPGQDATAEITGETPNLTLNLGIPQGPPGQDGVQLNDDAVNTTEAWSSKKIVDTLCPSFSVSGNPVTCNPVEDYPLSAVVTLEPIQAGEGDPSPENVRPISGLDSLQVTHSNDAGSSKTYSIALPETVYGGTVDVASGEGKKTWEYIEFDGTEKWIKRDTEYNTFSLALPIRAMTGISSHFKKLNITTLNEGLQGVYLENSGSAVFNYDVESLDSWKAYLAAQAAAGTPVTIAYQLSTPELFEVTPQPILALPGTNTLYTDGDSLIISGKEDIKYTINQITSNMQDINQIQEINNILLGVE